MEVWTKIAADPIEGEVHEYVKLEFGEHGTAIKVSEANPLPVAITGGYLGNQTGIWGYVAGVLTGAGSVTATGRCVGLRVFANAVDSSFNINGGSTIQVRSNSGVDLNPMGNLSNPVINWVSGSIDVLIEVVV